ncbi:MAG: hypothetical protein ACOVS5_15115 [Oligoflexus sp.]
MSHAALVLDMLKAKCHVLQQGDVQSCLWMALPSQSLSCQARLIL